jgi:hypothetical protein
MSDFFSGIYSGIQRPDVVMNNGPLPPMSMNGGYPEGFNANPDGKINYTSSLLGDLDPYAYGEAARLSTQAAYLNIPHVAQRIIPSLEMPEAQPFQMGGNFFRLSHQVDDGDVAFVIRAMFSPYELVSDKKKYNRQGILYAIDPVVNLATVNYILHGLQRYGFDKSNHKSWNTMWIALGIDQHFSGENNFSKIPFSMDMLNTQNELDKINENAQRNHKEALERLYCTLKMRVLRRKLVDYLIKHVIKPFGIPRGSEKQGGQHQGGNSPVTWPVDFVTAMVIDGKVINLVNFWKHDDINAGDDLVMYVEDRPCTEYVLSHHPKNAKKQAFPMLATWELPSCLAEYSKDGHVSNEAEDIVKRVWDLLSELVTMGDKSGNNALLKPPAPGTWVPDTFSRVGVSAEQLRSEWANFESIQSADAGRETLAARPRHYVTRSSIIEALPDEAILEIHSMLWDAADPERVLDFISRVQGHREAFQVRVSQAIATIAQQISNDVPEAGIHRRRDFEMARRLPYSTSAGLDKVHVLGAGPVLVRESIFQLVPGVSSSWCSGVKQAVWRHGYWHIARSQVMHFKYDQNVELHNGIHSAVRGKLLEATFAPVWVEPLESSVMGGGYGEEGSTTAQTFALSGMSGPKVKRQKFSHGSGATDVSMHLSIRFNAYSKLYSECVDFAALVEGKIGAGILGTGSSNDHVVYSKANIDDISSMFMGYKKLRTEKARLEAQPNLPAPNPSLDQEVEWSERLKTIKSAVDNVFFLRDEGVKCVDRWVHYLSTYLVLGPGAHPARLVKQVSNAVLQGLVTVC